MNRLMLLTVIKACTYSEPSLLGLVCDIFPHVSFESWHCQDTTEHALIVSIKQAADTGEARYSEYSSVGEEQGKA